MVQGLWFPVCHLGLGLRACGFWVHIAGSRTI